MKKIAIIDDFAKLPKLIMLMIKAKYDNYEVTYFTKYEDLEKYLDKNKVVLIIADYKLDENYTAENIYYKYKRNNNNFILFSGYDNVNVMTFTNKENIKCVIKPFFMPQLFNIINDMDILE